MSVRFVLAASAMAAAISWISSTAAAEQHEGIVRQIRIEADAGVPLCAATDPAMPGGAWACFYPNRPRYQEMKEMLFRAFEWRHRCTFEWSLRDAATNRAQIEVLSCSPG